MAPTKGKQGTKGQKQIVEENAATLKFYLYVICGANALFGCLTYVFFWDSFTTFYMFLVAGTASMYFGSYKFMSSMATPTYDPVNGGLIDGGIDLNLEHGMAEHSKDLILLTAGVQVLSLISNYFWLLLLLAPARAVYMLWVNFIGPWIFAEAPEQEVDEKKQRKMERKMKRREYVR